MIHTLHTQLDIYHLFYLVIIGFVYLLMQRNVTSHAVTVHSMYPWKKESIVDMVEHQIFLLLAGFSEEKCFFMYRVL